MELTATKSALRGRIEIPGSKSHTIRAVALAALADGESEIIAPLESSDAMAAVEAYRKLGAAIETGRSWKVQGFGGRPSVPGDIIDVGNSGTTMRFALGSAALLSEGAAFLTGDEQIRNRPQGPLLESLNDLGANCFSSRNNGMPPIAVRGQLRGGRTSIDAVTSQYLSSLLFNAPLAENDTVINVTTLNEQPYVEITLQYLDEQGIEYSNKNCREFEIKGRQSYKGFRKRIPADFSSATFFFCAGAILDAELTLCGLDFTDAQGDKAIVKILQEMGAIIQPVSESEITVTPGELKGIDVDMNDIPDALPALATVACFAEGQTQLLNVAQARLKETDRIKVMTLELSKLGADIEELPDGMIIRPGKLKAADLRGHSDHRVVMALTLAAMALEGECKIDSAEAVNVTFPNYVNLMQSVGANMKIG